MIPFILLITIYGSAYKTENFDELLEGNVNGNNFIISMKEESSKNLPEDLDNGIGKVKSSPYYEAFSNIKNLIFEDVELTYTTEENPFYSVSFIEYLIDHIMPYFAIWSAAGISQLGLARASNATAENAIKLYKYTTLDGEKKNLIPRMIQKSETMIQSKLKERDYPLITSRRQSNRKMKNSKEKKENPETKKPQKRKLTLPKVKKEGKRAKTEKWTRGKKRTGKQGNRYFKQPKNIEKMKEKVAETTKSYHEATAAM